MATGLRSAAVGVECIEFSVERSDVNHSVDDGGRREIHQVAQNAHPGQSDEFRIALVDGVLKRIYADARWFVLERWPVGPHSKGGCGGESAALADGLNGVRAGLRRFWNQHGPRKIPRSIGAAGAGC